MSFIYSVKNGSVFGVNGGSITITNGDVVDKVPKNVIEGISIFGNTQMSTQCARYCMENDISVSYFSMNGYYFGSLMPAKTSKASRIRKQIELVDSKDINLPLSIKITDAKINNQIIVAKRYSKDEDRIRFLKIIRKKLSNVIDKNALLGYEGLASRIYFRILSDAVKDDFKFKGRSQHPAKDPFNVMLNIGYSLLHKEIQGELINCGLNPYISFLHEERYGHAALASDLIEEWRPVIIDSTIMSLIQGNEISIFDFESNDEGKVVISSGGMNKLLSKIELKMRQENKYLSYQESAVTYRQAIWHQARCFARLVETKKLDSYSPIMIR